MLPISTEAPVQRRRTIYMPPQRGGMKKRIMLSEARDEFLNACRARKLSVHTLQDYNNTLNKFIAHVGNMSMNDVTVPQVSAFLASLPHSAKTVLNYHIGLSAFWTWAVRNEYVDRHIMHMVERPKPKKIIIEPFTEVEIRRLLDVIRHKPARNRAIIYMLLDTGLRASELVNIEREHINLDTRKLIVLGKGNKERLLHFSKQTARELCAQLVQCDGNPFEMGRCSLTLLMRRLGKRAGVRNVHPHRFRHTFAIQFLRNGGDIFTLQEMLGHSTLDMVKTYLAIAQVDIESAHERASPVSNWGL